MPDALEAILLLYFFLKKLGGNMFSADIKQFYARVCRGLSTVALAVTVCLMVPQSALAEEVSAEAKAKAQLTLAQWMKERSDDSGKFYFVDRQANELVAGYSANVHLSLIHI